MSLSEGNRTLWKFNIWLIKKNIATVKLMISIYGDLFRKLGWMSPKEESAEKTGPSAPMKAGPDKPPRFITVGDGDEPPVLDEPPRSFPPLASLIGNKSAKKRLERIAFDAWTRPLRSAAEFSIALIGWASTGKTEHARRLAQATCLPFVELQPQELKEIGDLYEKIRVKVDGAMIVNPLTGLTETFHCLDHEFDENRVPIKVTLPPCVAFIDEAHRLRPSIAKGGLLKATEHNDRQLVTESGIEVDTSNVCWIIATTERGMLFPALESRFSKVSLRLYSQHETAQIVKSKHPKLPDSACLQVAHYCRSVPREALAFCREMMSEKKMSKRSWEDCADTVAEESGIDEHGMTHQRLQVLEILSRGPCQKNHLAIKLNVKVQELERFILPPLQSVTPDQTEPLMSVCPKGFCITRPGLAQLDLRGIDYDIDQAIPPSVRRILGGAL